MRRKNKPSLHNKVIRKLPMVFISVGVIYLALLIKDIDVPTILPVNDIKVEGDLRYLVKSQIMDTVTDNITGGYFDLDLNQVRAVLLQQPWIKNAALRRTWPESVSVFIEENRPMAFWNKDAYISESGAVFRPEIIDQQLNLPHLNGPETQHEKVLKFMNVLYKQMARLAYQVKRLDLDDRRSWQMVIEKQVAVDEEIEEIKIANDAIEVKLGRYDTEKRLQRFIHVLPALASELETAENKIKVIDMRYPNGFAVRMSEQNKVATNDYHSKKIMHDSELEITQVFVYAHRNATLAMSGV